MIARSPFDGHGEARSAPIRQDTWRRQIPIQLRRRLVEEHHDRSPIEPRSWHNRAAIVDPSAWNRFHDPRTTSKVDHDHDRGPIAERSWLDRGAIVASFEANLRPIHHQIWADSSRN